MQNGKKKPKKALIVGAGLAGSLWAVYLQKAGYVVDIYERRPDMRLQKLSAGRSINLATSYRGWKALDGVGVGDDIRQIAIPMYGRTMHNLDKTTVYQPYGNAGQAIYSVSRGAINAKLMDIAEDKASATIHFNQECVDVQLEQGVVTFKNTQSGKVIKRKADVVFAADGAFSAVRYRGMQKLNRFNYSQHYIQDGYKELLLPANPDGSYKMAKETLHIWPRGRFMLIALPNLDGSFTCTLFMPFDGHEDCFNNLKTKADVERFFKRVFPDFYDMLPNVADTWDDFPLSSLAIIRCAPWTYGRVALIGDAAHATVPFYGQGMNASFEDCSVLWELVQAHGDDWNTIFEDYNTRRKPNGDAMQDLSVHNYTVMRDRVADPDFLLLQKIERRVNFLYPKSYFPLYSMVSFTDIDYATAWNKGKEQEAMLKAIIADNGITHDTSEAEIDGIINQTLQIHQS